MLVSKQLRSVCVQFVLLPLSSGMCPEKLQMTGVSVEGWLGAGGAGSIGSQSLQTVTAYQWVGSSCSLPELIGVAVDELYRHLPYGICEKKNLDTIGAL